jgi:hypothetical protein
MQCNLLCVHSETASCGSDQGRSIFDAAGVAALGRKILNGFAITAKCENAELDRKMPFLDGHISSSPARHS